MTNMTIRVREIPSYYDRLDAVLDSFQWAYPDRGENRGEIHLDRDTNELVLTVYVQDTETPEDEHVHPLRVSMEIDTSVHPEDAVRQIIHFHLCHEADEQMWFDNERPFYPHHEHPGGNNGNQA